MDELEAADERGGAGGMAWKGFGRGAAIGAGGGANTGGGAGARLLLGPGRLNTGGRSAGAESSRNGVKTGFWPRTGLPPLLLLVFGRLKTGVGLPDASLAGTNFPGARKTGGREARGPRPLGPAGAFDPCEASRLAGKLKTEPESVRVRGGSELSGGEGPDAEREGANVEPLVLDEGPTALTPSAARPVPCGLAGALAFSSSRKTSNYRRHDQVNGEDDQGGTYFTGRCAGLLELRGSSVFVNEDGKLDNRQY